MANVLFKNVELAAENLLSFFNKANNELKLAPEFVSAIAVTFAAIDKVLSDIALDAANPAGLINIPMDTAQLADLKAVWPTIKTEAASVGIKL